MPLTAMTRIGKADNHDAGARLVPKVAAPSSQWNSSKRNRKMKRAISPEIERVVKQSTLSLNGEDGDVIFVRWREYEIASGVRTYGMLPKDSM